jgi:DNA-binding transcriptional ArsR family regulator
MLEPDDAMALDRLIHEPNRLAILTILSTTQDADFVFLQRALRLTNGNLSSHLTKLEAGGLVELEKSFVGKKPNTRAALTVEGRRRVATHWEQLDRLKHLSVPPHPPD